MTQEEFKKIEERVNKASHLNWKMNDIKQLKKRLDFIGIDELVEFVAFEKHKFGEYLSREMKEHIRELITIHLHQQYKDAEQEFKEL